MYVLGSKEGRRGYSRQIPTELNAVWRVSLSVKSTRLILDWAGSDGALTGSLRSSVEHAISSKNLGMRLLRRSRGSSETVECLADIRCSSCKIRTQVIVIRSNAKVGVLRVHRDFNMVYVLSMFRVQVRRVVQSSKLSEPAGGTG